jgi:hypothetical protein
VKWMLMAGCGLMTVAVGVAAVGGGADDVSDPLGRRRSAEVSAQLRAVAERSRVKLEAAGALVRGEVSVHEAEDDFRRVLATDPLVWSRLRATWPDAPDRQLVLRNLADYVRWQYRGDAERVAAVLAQLDREMAEPIAPVTPRATVIWVE